MRALFTDVEQSKSRTPSRNLWRFSLLCVQVAYSFSRNSLISLVWLFLLGTDWLEVGPGLDLRSRWPSPRRIPSVLSPMGVEFPLFLVQFSSVTQSCLALCDPMDCSTPGLAVHHQLPEFTQTPAHWVGDAIQPSYPLSSPSPPALNLSQHQGLFKWVSSSHQVAKVLEFQLQMNTQDWSPLGWTGWISLQSKGLSRVFSNTTVQKHHFFCAQLSL